MLRFSFLAAMDGNNSLKLVDSTFRSGSERTDNRQTSSKRWISPDDVDVFKDEVNKKVSCYFPHEIAV
jgi:KDZ transposase-like protein